MREVRIWTDDEELIVDTEDVGELETAMRFKAANIKAKADPELFTAVADSLSSMWNTASIAIEQANTATEVMKRLLDALAKTRR